MKIYLEPIGIIGWANPQLFMIDEIGLATPDVAARRVGPPGWLTDAFMHYGPDLALVRSASFVHPNESLIGVGAPFRSESERLRVYAPYKIVSVYPSDARRAMQYPSSAFMLGHRQVPGTSFADIRPGPMVTGVHRP